MVRHRFLALHTDGEIIETRSIDYEPGDSVRVDFTIPAHRRKTERYTVSIWNDLGELCGKEKALTGIRLHGGCQLSITLVPTNYGETSIWD